MRAELDFLGPLEPPKRWGHRSRIRCGRNTMSWALDTLSVLMLWKIQMASLKQKSLRP